MGGGVFQRWRVEQHGDSGNSSDVLNWQSTHRVKHLREQKNALIFPRCKRWQSIDNIRRHDTAGRMYGQTAFVDDWAHHAILAIESVESYQPVRHTYRDQTPSVFPPLHIPSLTVSLLNVESSTYSPSSLVSKEAKARSNMSERELPLELAPAGETTLHDHPMRQDVPPITSKLLLPPRPFWRKTAGEYSSPKTILFSVTGLDVLAS